MQSVGGGTTQVRPVLMRAKLATFVAWLAGVLAIYLRAPALFSEPRFWAEEGTVYFSYAFNHPWYDALLTPHGLYLLLYTNLVAILTAHFVPLMQAPLATTLAALAVQALPLALILGSTSELWRSLGRKLVGVLIVLAVPISGEIWLTTTNSQFYFSLAVTLILLEDAEPASHARVWLYRILLPFSGLTGPVSCFLTPLFVVKAWRRRGREHAVQAGVLVACTGIQLAVLWSMRRNMAVAGRFTMLDPPTLAGVLWTNTLMWPVFGLAAARAVAAQLLLARAASAWTFTCAGYVLLAVEVLWFRYLAAGLPSKQRWFLVGSFFFLATMSSLLSAGSAPDKSALIEPGYGGRYFYVPVVLFLLMLLLNVRRGAAAHRVATCSSVLAVAIAYGVWHYTPPPATGPSWRAEVRRWQQDPAYRLRIWPAGWTVILEKR